MNTCYRLIISRLRKGADPVSHDAVVLWASTAFQGATIYEASGLWEGAVEPTTVIERYGDHNELEDFEAASDEARVRFGQESVLLAYGPVTARLVTS